MNQLIELHFNIYLSFPKIKAKINVMKNKNYLQNYQVAIIQYQSKNKIIIFLTHPHMGLVADVGCHYVYGYLNTSLLYNVHGPFEQW